MNDDACSFTLVFPRKSAGAGISLGRNRSSREERLCSRSTSSGYGNGSRTPNGVWIVVIRGVRVATDRYCSVRETEKRDIQLSADTR